MAFGSMAPEFEGFPVEFFGPRGALFFTAASGLFREAPLPIAAMVSKAMMLAPASFPIAFIIEKSFFEYIAQLKTWLPY